MTVSFSFSVTVAVTVKIWLGAIGVIINGPSDEEAVGAGAAGGASLEGAGAPLEGAGAPLGGAGAPVGEGSTLVMAYEVFDEAASLEEGADDEAGALDRVADEGWTLRVVAGAVLRVLEMTDEMALMDEEGATGDAAACDEDNRADDATGVSAGADDGDGGTVVYCVTITTGGTGSEVEGRSSTAETEDWVDEGAGTAGIGAAAELDTITELAGALETRVEAGTELAGGDTSEAAVVGKTVVYKVLVTTRRVDVVIVRLPDAGIVEFTGAAEGSTGTAAEELTKATLVELATALLRAAVSFGVPGWVNPGIPVPF